MQKYFYVYVQKMFYQKEKFAVFFLPDDDLMGKYLATILHLPKVLTLALVSGWALI